MSVSCFVVTTSVEHSITSILFLRKFISSIFLWAFVVDFERRCWRILFIIPFLFSCSPPLRVLLPFSPYIELQVFIYQSTCISFPFFPGFMETPINHSFASFDFQFVAVSVVVLILLFWSSFMSSCASLCSTYCDPFSVLSYVSFLALYIALSIILVAHFAKRFNVCLIIHLPVRHRAHFCFNMLCASLTSLYHFAFTSLNYVDNITV